MTKTWLVTGTSTGFGREMTEQLLERGERVAATLRHPAVLDGLSARFGDQLWVRELDVTNTPQLRQVIGAAFAELGRVDVVVSNAGYGLLGAAEELTDVQIARQIDTNLVGSLQLARAVVPPLRAQGGGRILQVSSMCGHIGFPGLSLYTATKWAIEGFYETLRLEVAPFGIHTCLVEPGNARTEFAFSSRDEAEAMDEYAATPVGLVRERVYTQKPAELPGDPTKIVAAMINAAEADELPTRLLLGSDAYALVSKSLTDRLTLIEAQKELALSTDARDYDTAGEHARMAQGLKE
jgi:NAD(P)-dependent dehydrogenase (short-subunit alcohol dehydrogenase family)